MVPSETDKETIPQQLYLTQDVTMGTHRHVEPVENFEIKCGKCGKEGKIEDYMCGGEDGGDQTITILCSNPECKNSEVIYESSW